MRKFKRLTMTLALLIMAVGGAWAQSSLNVVELKAPAEWETDESNLTPADLPGFYTSTKAEAKAWKGAPAEGSAMLIYAFEGDDAHYVYFDNGTPEDEDYKFTFTKASVFLFTKIYYTVEPADPTEWLLTPDADKKVWTLYKMPASNIELQVEYFAESNLFLSKDALADAGSIAVKAGETTVEFDDDGKSANTVTEGTPMTVTYNGTKKLLGMKVEKKEAAPAYTLLSAATTSDYGKVVCAAGHLHDAKTAVPDGCTAVGILGKVTETGHGLILALKDAAEQSWNTINGWTSVTTYASTTLKLLPDDAARGSLASYTTLGETTVSNWAVGQKSDYDAIFTNLGSTKGNENGKTFDDNVNAYITTGVGGTAIAINGHYRSATEKGDKAWGFAKSFWSGYEVQFEYSVRPVLGF